jgi:hypothetical protein
MRLLEEPKKPAFGMIVIYGCSLDGVLRNLVIPRVLRKLQLCIYGNT